MIQLILYAMFAAGLAFAGYKVWDGFVGQYVARGAAAQLEADKPVIDKANLRADQAEERAARAEEGAAKAKAASARQNAAIASSKAVSEASQKLSKELTDMYTAEVAKGQAKNKALYDLTVAVPRQGQSCDEMLAATDKILREAAKARGVR
jgi:uncharacterized phage infection (PIP) family protein YhgE